MTRLHGRALIGILVSACLPSLFPASLHARDFGRVVILGDSITQGKGGVCSYRYELWKRLVDGGDTFDFVGSMRNNMDGSTEYPGHAGKTFDPDHEGHWGWRTSDILGATPPKKSPASGKGKLSDWLNEYTPDTVLMLIGGNDVHYGDTPRSAIDNNAAIIKAFKTANPSAVVYLGSLTPRGEESSMQEKLQQINTGLHQLAASLPSVAYVDLWEGMDIKVHTYDGCHPSPEGEKLIAARFYDAMINTPADCIFMENGKPLNLLEDRVETGGARPGKWTRLDGWLQSHDNANTIFAGKSLSKGDFHVSARLAIDDLEKADVSLHVPEAIWALRFRDENGNISITGRVTGKGRAVVMAKTADHIQPGKPFLFEMIRKGEKIFFQIDGTLIFDRQWPRDPMGLFGFIAGSGSLRISDFWATGRLDEIPSQDQLPQIPVFTGVEDNPDGSYPINSLRFRIPSLILSPKGDLLAFAEARHEGASDAGNIDLAMKRSRDGGRTWGKSQLVHEQGGQAEITIGNPCPVVDEETGVIWMAFCRNNRDVFVTSSADDGHTWAEPTEITKDVQRGWGWYATGPGVGIQLKRGEQKGRLVIPCNHKPSHVFYSDDHGKSWKLGGNAAKGTDESQVVELVDGSLMLNCRSGARREVFLSKDSGESFEKYSTQELVLGGCQASILRYSTGENGGKSRLLFSNPNSKQWRVNLTVRLSDDEGKTWSVSRVIDPGSAQYSCLVVLPDGDIGVLYEDAGKSRLTYTRFSLDWLTNGKNQ